MNSLYKIMGPFDLNGEEDSQLRSPGITSELEGIEL